MGYFSILHDKYFFAKANNNVNGLEIIYGYKAVSKHGHFATNDDGLVRCNRPALETSVHFSGAYAYLTWLSGASILSKKLVNLRPVN